MRIEQMTFSKQLFICPFSCWRCPWWFSLSMRPIISYAPYIAHYGRTCRPQNRKYITYCIDFREGSQVTRMENLVKFYIWFWDIPADRHTLKHTDTIVHTPTGGDVTRMWANAQRDGRPAARSWCPLFNAAKFGWHPLLECRAVTLPRRETRWNLQGCPKLPNRS